MLIEFSIANTLSFKELVTFSMLASSLGEKRETNVSNFTYPKSKKAKEIGILKSAAIYGANASGKSNLFKAINFFRNFVINSATKTHPSQEIPVRPFFFDEETKDKPSFFQIIFINNNIKYRYGFEISPQSVTSEWLFSSEKGKEAKLFVRENQSIEIGKKFDEAKGLKNKTRNNALFLSVIAQFNGKISIAIIDWFQSISVISGIEDEMYRDTAFTLLKDEECKKAALELLKLADLCIEKVEFIEKEENIEKLPKQFVDAAVAEIEKNTNGQDVAKEIKYITRDVLTYHTVYKNNTKVGVSPLSLLWESEGTKKFLFLSGLIIDAIQNGKVLVIDEFDASLHPLLSIFIISMFNSTKNKNAQLILATHDTNLLSNKYFRRDQIWFVEKDKYGASELYALSDHNVRLNSNYEKDYFVGRYGGIPFIRNTFDFEENDNA